MKKVITVSKEHNKCAIYLRVSTSQQVEHGQSLEVQKHQLIARAISDGYLHEDIVIFEDPGISGSKFENRPEILKLIERIQSDDNDIGRIYSFKLDRISRSTHEIHWFINLCSECGVHYVSLKDGIDTSNPTLGKILVTVFGLVSELELENIKIRTTESRLKRYREGKSLGGPLVSLGYKRMTNSRRETYFEIVEEEAKIIRFIFDSYANGMGKLEIVENLNKQGYKTRTNNEFMKSSIDRILRNPIYIGMIRYNNPERNKRRNKDDPILVDGLHEPIISKEIWDKAQRRQRRYKITVKRNFEEYLFSSKINCNKCENKLYGKRTGAVNKKDNRRHMYYKCSNTKCHSKPYRVDLTDKILLNALITLLQSAQLKSFLKKSLVKAFYKASNGLSDEGYSKEDLESIEKRKSNLIEQYAYGVLDETLYLQAIKIVNEKITKIKTGNSDEDEVSYKVDKTVEAHIDDDINEFIKNAIKIIKGEDIEKKQQIDLINEVVKSIHLVDMKQGKVAIELNIDKILFLKIIEVKPNNDYQNVDFDLVYKA